MGKRARILVVDDDETIRKVLSTILKEEGYLVDTAETGKEAIEKSKSRSYNLALIDIHLPDMDGTKLLVGMRQTVPRMVKIIVTGYPSLQNAMEAVNRNADAYIIKPVNIDNVLKVIREQLRKQQENGEYSQQKVAEFIETRVKEIEENSIVTRKRSR